MPNRSMSRMRDHRTRVGVSQLRSPVAWIRIPTTTHDCRMFAITTDIPPKPSAASPTAANVYDASPAVSVIPIARNSSSRASTRSGIAPIRRMKIASAMPGM